MNKKSVKEMVLEVLEQTNDGEDLLPEDLSLVMSSIHSDKEDPSAELCNLHTAVFDGTYANTCWYVVEPFTIDHEGYVYYKNQMVEHFSEPNTVSSHVEIHKLKQRCEYLEENNLTVSLTNAVLIWDIVSQINLIPEYLMTMSKMLCVQLVAATKDNVTFPGYQATRENIVTGAYFLAKHLGLIKESDIPCEPIKYYTYEEFVNAKEEIEHKLEPLEFKIKGMHKLPDNYNLKIAI